MYKYHIKLKLDMIQGDNRCNKTEIITANSIQEAVNLLFELLKTPKYYGMFLSGFTITPIADGRYKSSSFIRA